MTQDRIPGQLTGNKKKFGCQNGYSNICVGCHCALSKGQRLISTVERSKKKFTWLKYVKHVWILRIGSAVSNIRKINNKKHNNRRLKYNAYMHCSAVHIGNQCMT